MYYFHGYFRCASCQKIEDLTKGALEEFFYDEIASGDIDYRVVNIEEKGNEYYSVDYKLYTKSVVLSKVKDGEEIQYENLDKIWNFLRNKNKFYEYIRTEVTSFIN